ncbi:hypothetical protein K7432_004268 [Basidiobolus ranarum]|uniref:Peptidase S9 prolyl oligopeptidase catalytic domain-containing protein n=1 Tax=Basidiobolus ranarum TaxID=34480 RepID=A0ABR2W4W0_9FUNG
MQEIEATKNDPLPTGEPVRVEIKDGMVSPFNINSESLRNKRNDKLGERGILSPLIVGFDPRSPINAGKLAKLTPSDMVNENYPPVYLMHGDSDQLVPYEHSKDIESACQRMGIEVKLDIVPGVGHCFDLAVEHGDEIFNHHILPIFDFMAEKFQ